MHHITAEQFKQALGSFVSGVTVITARQPDGSPYGVTISAFAALSLAPRLVSFALNRDGNSHQILSAASSFAIHILAEGQEELSAHFARHGHLWDPIDHTWDADGLPVLSGALSRLSCRKMAQITPQEQPVGDHDLFIGEILASTTDLSRRPLVYFRSHYHGLAA